MWWLAAANAAMAEPPDYRCAVSIGTGSHFGAGALGSTLDATPAWRVGGNFRVSFDQSVDLTVGLGMSGIAASIDVHPVDDFQPFFIGVGVAPLYWAGRGYVWDRNGLPYLYGPDMRVGAVAGPRNHPLAVTVALGIGAISLPLYGVLTAPVAEVGVTWRLLPREPEPVDAERPGESEAE